MSQYELPESKAEHKKEFRLILFCPDLGNEHVKFRTEIPVLFHPQIVREMNEIILSPKESWYLRIIQLIEKFESEIHILKVPALGDSLHQFLLLEDIPFKVLQVVHHKFSKMKELIRTWYGYDYHFFCVKLERVIEMSERKCMEYIGKLTANELVQN